MASMNKRGLRSLHGVMERGEFTPYKAGCQRVIDIGQTYVHSRL